MYIYWRVQQDLNEMGNIIIFHHAGIIRELKKWVSKNSAGLALAEDLTPYEYIKKSISPN
jgi:hypothetical protein